MPVRPNFARIIITGAVLGAIVGIVVAALSREAPNYSTLSGYGYLGGFFAGIGALLAAVIAVLLDRRIDRDRR